MNQKTTLVYVLFSIALLSMILVAGCLSSAKESANSAPPNTASQTQTSVNGSSQTTILNLWTYTPPAGFEQFENGSYFSKGACNMRIIRREVYGAQAGLDKVFSLLENEKNKTGNWTLGPITLVEKMRLGERNAVFVTYTPNDVVFIYSPGEDGKAPDTSDFMTGLYFIEIEKKNTYAILP